MLCAIAEYGMGNEVSTFGDIYSYGILLLEMFTGKRPTDNIFKDDLNLHDFVRGALPEQVINIVDPIILLEREDMETRTTDTHIQNRIGCPKILECLILIFGIGVSCSMESPRERMNISDVVAQLHLIRDKLLRTRRHRGRLQLTGKLFMTQYLLLLTPPPNHYGGRGIIYPTQCYVLVMVLSFVLAKLIILMLCEI